jgi:uncharacterized membrane protein
MWIPGQPTPVNTVSKTAESLRSASAHAPSAPSSLKDNLTAALAYVTFIPAVVFLLTEPFKRNRFVRFHSAQSLLLTIATILAALVLRGLYSVLALIPVAGYLLAWLTAGVWLLGWIILWLVLLIKAFQGETFKAPVIGRIAEKM